MRNILLIAVDTLRPDHLGCYGYARETSPRLDELAGRADLFTACWSASNFTAPAFTSLFTGLHPHEHGVFDFQKRVASAPVRAVLEDAGVRTGGVVSFRFLERLLGNVWGGIEAVTDTRTRDYAKDQPRAVSDGAVAWLEGHDRTRPFALFLHYDGPHLPYRLPEEHAGRFGPMRPAGLDAELAAVFCPQEREDLGEGRHEFIASMFRTIERIDWGRRRIDDVTLRWLVDRYDESIRYTDTEIGRVLDALRRLGLAGDTIVAVVSDHGEELMDHGHLAHGGIHLYESTIRTVAIAADPAAPGPCRRDRPVSHVDLLPWLLSLAGAEPRPDGRAAPDLRRPDAGEPVYCIGEFKAAVRRGPLKLIRRRILPSHPPLKRLRLAAKLLMRGEWGDELYDLATDPGERRNLAGSPVHRPDRRELGRLLDAHLAAQAVPPAPRDDGPDDEERARIEKELRDLGYM